MNDVYRSFFGSDFPARATVQTGLVAADGLVEIMVTADAGQMTVATLPLGVEAFEAAYRHVAPHIHHTPLLTSRMLSERDRASTSA